MSDHIKNTLTLPQHVNVNSKFCQEHNIKVPLIPLDKINEFQNGLPKGFKDRINNQPYIKGYLKRQEHTLRKEIEKETETYIDRQNYWTKYIMERQKLSKETLENIK